MGTRKDQHKAGTPAKPRGQQTGFAGNPDQNREEMEKTPALRGRRKKENKMFGDSSEQHVAASERAAGLRSVRHFEITPASLRKRAHLGGNPA